MTERPSTPDPRLAKFRDTAGRRCSGLLCLRCGSTSIDQRFINQLACTSCGQTTAWQGRKFTVLRGVKMTRSAIYDAVRAFEHSRLGIRGYAKKGRPPCARSGKKP